MNYHEKIKGIIKEQIPLSIDIAEVSYDMDLFSIGMDSLNCIRVVFSLEDHFDIIFADDDLTLDLLRTIDSLADYVQRVAS